MVVCIVRNPFMASCKRASLWSARLCISPARHWSPAIITRQTTGWRLPCSWDITALFPCQHRMTKATSLIGHDGVRMAHTNMCNDHTSTAQKWWPSSSTAARGTTAKNSALTKCRKNPEELLWTSAFQWRTLSRWQPVTKDCIPCRRAVSEALPVQTTLPYWACKGAAPLAVLWRQHRVVYALMQQHLPLVSLCFLRRLAAWRVFSAPFPSLDSKMNHYASFICGKWGPYLLRN